MSPLGTAVFSLVTILGVLAYRPDTRAATGHALDHKAGQAPAVAETTKEPARTFRLAEEQKSRKRRQCEALNECRRQFTICYNEIHDNPKKTWETHENDCGIPYRDCIKANFKTGEMWFTRMFNPFVLKCEKY